MAISLAPGPGCARENDDDRAGCAGVSDRRASLGGQFSTLELRRAVPRRSRALSRRSHHPRRRHTQALTVVTASIHQAASEASSTARRSARPTSSLRRSRDAIGLYLANKPNRTTITNAYLGMATTEVNATIATLARDRSPRALPSEQATEPTAVNSRWRPPRSGRALRRGPRQRCLATLLSEGRQRSPRSRVRLAEPWSKRPRSRRRAQSS